MIELMFFLSGVNYGLLIVIAILIGERESLKYETGRKRN